MGGVDVDGLAAQPGSEIVAEPVGSDGAVAVFDDAAIDAFATEMGLTALVGGWKEVDVGLGFELEGFPVVGKSCEDAGS